MRLSIHRLLCSIARPVRGPALRMLGCGGAVLLAACSPDTPAPALASHPSAPVAIAPAPRAAVSAASECFDPSLDVVGTRLVLDRIYSGPQTGELHSEITFTSDAASFEGHSGLSELTDVTTGALTAPKGKPAIPQNLTNRQYQKTQAPGVYARYGGTQEGVLQAGGMKMPAKGKTVHAPPYVDARATLAVGESGSYKAQGRMTAAGHTVAFDTDTSVKLVALETISVPAGSYRTCRFEVTAAHGAMHTEWFYRGVAIQLLRETPAGMQTVQLKAATLNGGKF